MRIYILYTTLRMCIFVHIYKIENILEQKLQNNNKQYFSRLIPLASKSYGLRNR